MNGAAWRPELGAELVEGGVRFRVRSATADRIWACIFDERGERETDRIELARQGQVFSAIVPGLGVEARYGLRADGEYSPEKGLWFDPDKLLVDPYAIEIDRPYVYDARLAATRGAGSDTAAYVPKAIVTAPSPVTPQAPLFRPGLLVYEVGVKGFSALHPDVPPEARGTLAAIAHPSIIEHLLRIGVGAVEMMPVTAWIDERHLGPLGLHNAWGYNPVTLMALDPRLAPGGVADLRKAVAALRQAGIGVILDLVFNHTGESDALGPTLSLRGLDNRTYYRHEPDGRLVNDTGCGNTIDCSQPAVTDLVLDTLRHFVVNTGVDGFRFDLAPIMGRSATGFDAGAPLLSAIAADPLLADRVMIAEPWDIGPGGYQLGRFRPPMLEWNDKYRDRTRRFWRGDAGMLGEFATSLAGSSDVFAVDGQTETRSVDFLAAHDGFPLADIVRYAAKHNEANGENNCDGHDENLSWNNGVEGESDDETVRANRRRDLFALLSTLFVSRGTIMLTAGDEFGRTQRGNNNAYAQDNEITWLDWANRDVALAAHVAELSALRRDFAPLSGQAFLTGSGDAPDVEWLTETGRRFEEADWNDPARRRITMILANPDPTAGITRLAVVVNGDRRSTTFSLPQTSGLRWVPSAGTERDIRRSLIDSGFLVECRSVVLLLERELLDQHGASA